MNRTAHTLAGMVALVASGLAVALVPSCVPDLPSDAASELGVSLVPRCGDGIVQLAMGEQCDPGSATVVGCTSSCRVECDAGFHWTRNDHCYMDIAPAAVRLSDANARCAAVGGHLVTFASDEELAAVVAGTDAGSFWVGMYEGVSKFDSVASLEPGWEPGCSGCFAHASNPATSLPGVAIGQACVDGYANLDASWQQAPCSGTKVLSVICEREPVGRLSQPCAGTEGGACLDVRFTYGQKRYVYMRTSASADDARKRCRELGGTLVVFESRDEREQLWKELARLSGTGLPSSFWIGLSAPDAGSAWTWDDDALIDAYAPPWADHEPSDGGTRAYVYENGAATPTVDDTLAHAAPPSLLLPSVCQLVERGP